MREKKDFFISYTKTDRRWAEWVAWHLEKAGYTTVIQAWDFRPGGNFVLQMQKATARAERTIAVLSPDYLTSEFAQPEWQARFAEDSKGEKGLLVPVRVRECDPEGLLLRAILVENRDPVDGTGNFITIAPGSNGITNWITGTTPFVRIPAGGLFLATMPEGIDTLNDGADDEILLTADTASVITRLTYLFG